MVGGYHGLFPPANIENYTSTKTSQTPKMKRRQTASSSQKPVERSRTSHSSITECPELPQDLITQILLRTPVKSMVRFRLVCKTWYDFLKPFSFEDWVRSYNFKSGLAKLELKILRSIPINLPDNHIRHDDEIISIIRNSETLRRPPRVFGTPSRGGRPFKLIPGPTTFSAVVGAMSYGGIRLSGDTYTLACRETYGKKDLVKLTNHDALFILLVSSHAVVVQFAEAKFADRFNCIVVSSLGQPNSLIRMATQFDLPVLAFLDTDPRSLEILAFYGRKLKNVKWLGIRPTDTDMGLLFQPLTIRPGPSFATLAMTDDDFKTREILLKDSYIKSRPQWLDELNCMLKMQQKIEVHLLGDSSVTDYVTRVLLPMKLQNEDWI